MKHFTDDLQPHPHDDSGRGLMYVPGDVQFTLHLGVKAFFLVEVLKSFSDKHFFFDSLTIGNQSLIMNAQNIWRRGMTYLLISRHLNYFNNR